MALIVGAVVLLVALYAKPFLEARIVEQARARGIEIEIGSFEWSFSQITLRDTSVRLVGVRTVAAKFERTQVELKHFFEPAAVVVEGAAVDVTGSAPAVALEVAEWTRSYPHAIEGPLTAQQVSVRWREAAGDDPWLDLHGGQVAPTSGGGKFLAPATEIWGIEVGPVGAVWTAKESAVDLGFGAEAAEEAPVRVVVRHGEIPPTATFTLRPVTARRLSEPLGAQLPISDRVLLSGEVQLTLPPAFQSGPIEGTAKLSLKGYIPPHPVELDGFVFGDTTTVETRLSVAADRRTVTLTDTRLTAGRFILAGQGEIHREDAFARLQLTLRGDLPCNALADAAAQSRLGATLGRIVGPMARQLVDGSVAVVVKVEADSRNLQQAKVLRTIGVGCGLKPLVIPGLGTLDLGKVNLDDLNLDQLPPLPAEVSVEVPPLPSSLPPLPTALPFPALPAPPGRLIAEPAGSAR